MRSRINRSSNIGLFSLAATFAFLLVSFFATQTMGQSLIAGDIAGTVVDPSGAAVPDASVVLKSLDTAAVTEGKTNSDGYYRFSLLRPGRYEVTVSKGGFKSVIQNVDRKRR